MDMLCHRARCQPNDTAFIFLTDGKDEQVRLTYRELDRKARAIAAWLESLDMVGQRALLFYPPGLEFIEAFFGCLYAKVVAVPVYPPRANQLLSRLKAIAEDAEARLALSTRDVLGRVRQVAQTTPGLRDLTWLATCDVPAAMHRDWQRLDVRGDTLAFLQYTSGSTGMPKGVMLSHTNLLHNSAMIAHAFEHSRSSLGVFWLPNFHDMGLIGGILQPLYIGCPNVMMSPMAFLQHPYRWLSAISRFRATTSGGPNFAYDLCARKITEEERRNLDLSSWKVAFNGAEPIRAATIDRFAETFAACGFRREAFYPCYGLAEATLIVSGGQTKKAPVIRSLRTDSLARGRAVEAPPANGQTRMLVGSGKVLPDEEIVIADPETTTSCPEGNVGEIWVRGVSVAQGYWRKPEATETTFGAYLEDTGDGPFLRTGDLGFLRDGELFVTGRVKDLIIVRGENHYPHDIEATVEQSHQRLRPGCGAVFAVEVDQRELLIVAHEVHRHRNGSLKEVFDRVRRQVSMKHDLAVDAIVAIKAGGVPKTSSGKIQRHGCRDAWLAGSLPVVAQWVAPGALGVVPMVPGAAPGDGNDEKAVEQNVPEPLSEAVLPPSAVLATADEIPSETYRIAEFPECVEVRRSLETVESVGSPRRRRDPRRLTARDELLPPNERFIDFSSTNYLGMSGHPAVSDAAKEAVNRYGTSASAGWPVSGGPRQELETAIARFLETEDALTFRSGHDAAESVVGQLFGPEDLVLYDARAEGGIPQGALRSGARRHAFRHNDFGAVDGLLAKCRRQYRRVLIAVEGICPTEGDFPDLPEFVDVKRRHKAILLIDEAHSVGTLGMGGRGIGELFDVDRPDVELWVGSLGNALGSCGGYLAAGRQVIDYLEHAIPAIAVAAPLSPSDAGAAIAAIDLLEREPDRVARLQARSQRFRVLAENRGIDTGAGRDTPIVPIVLKESNHGRALSDAMLRRGIQAWPVFHPALPRENARLQFLINEAHSEDDIQRAMEVLAEELERLDPAYVQASRTGERRG
jgi:acyl-CoA synthetase (AMP-forming)/AMP-acid ligase II/7-keto-8-aminopelargonate synthetase-like enzyme